jgi:hypothetical protein
VSTPNDLITLALRDSGICGTGQNPLAQDVNDGFTRLNQMLAQWQRKRWLIWHLIDIAIPSTGAQSYSIGPGGDVNMLVRPDRLENGCFFRQIINASPPNQIDYPLTILESREDYSRIALKQLKSFGEYVFYDSAFPLGHIFPWPIPQADIYEIHICIKELLNSFTTLSQTIVLPPEYDAAITYNLQRRFRAAYRLPPDPEINALARDSLNVIRMANAQIPRLQMPRELVRPNGHYNVYSDQIR